MNEALSRLAAGRDLDRAWEAVRLAKRPRVHTFLATSPIHMEYKLKMTPDEASPCCAICNWVSLRCVRALTASPALLSKRAASWRDLQSGAKGEQGDRSEGEVCRPYCPSMM